MYGNYVAPFKTSTSSPNFEKSKYHTSRKLHGVFWCVTDLLQKW